MVEKKFVVVVEENGVSQRMPFIGNDMHISNTGDDPPLLIVHAPKSGTVAVFKSWLYWYEGI